MQSDLTNELMLLIRSRHPIVSIETADETRAVELVTRVARDMGRPLFDWSVTTGLRRRLPQEGGRIAKTESPGHALAFVHDATQSALYVFRDLGRHLKDAALIRRLRDIQSVFKTHRSTLILIDVGEALPPELRRLAVPFDVKWPDAEELMAVVRATLQEARVLDRAHVKISRRQLERLVQGLRGLTRSEAARAVAAAVYDDNVLNSDDLPRIVEAKRKTLASHGILESVPVDVSPEDLGGLEGLKQWVKRRRDGFSRKAREFGLPPPRGILLLGVQGCGKSLCAKIVAAFWNLPLLRMDPGVLYQKWVGETEARLRRALSQAETMAPVVLWIDEIEKTFASVSGASADGGLSQRIFGTLLSWMQEHRQTVFIVATANDVSRLPPELMRKGRFDEVFFVDLPDEAARAVIFGIHLRKRNRDAGAFDLDRLAAASAGFSGAEIEQAIVAALYGAFSDGAEIDDDRLEAELKATRPLSVLMAERLAELREWARDRCVSAD